MASDVELLFGVQKGTYGQLSGEINDIMSRITAKPFKIKVELDTSAVQGQLEGIQSQIAALSAPISLDVSNINIGAAAESIRTQLDQIINGQDKNASVTLTANGADQVKAQMEQAGNAAEEASRKTKDYESSVKSAAQAASAEEQNARARLATMKQAWDLLTRLEDAEKKWTAAKDGKSSAAYDALKRDAKSLRELIEPYGYKENINIAGISNEKIQQISESVARAKELFAEYTNEIKSNDEAVKSASDKNIENLIHQGDALNQYIQRLNSVETTKTEQDKVSDLVRRYNEWAEAVQRVQNVKNASPDEISRLQKEAAALDAQAKSAENLRMETEQSSQGQHLLVKGTKEYASALNQLNNALIQAKNNQKNWTAARTGKSSEDYANMGIQISEIERLKAELDAGTLYDNQLKERFAIAVSGIKNYSEAIRAAGENTSTFGSKFGKLAQQFSVWFSATRVVMMVVNNIKKMVSDVVAIDSALTQLKIVTGATDAELQSFLTSASGLAKELGQNITDVLGSIETFSRLGYNLPDASKLAEYAGILSNVASVSTEEATKGITSIIKGYDMNVSDTEHVADVLVQVGQKYAVSAGEMMEAFEKSSAALGATNTSFEKSAGLIAAANAAVQNASTVGTALKTISARIRVSETELSELGEDTSDLADGFSKYAEELKSITGFDILVEGTTNTYKDIYDIFEGISKVWDQLSDTQQSRVAEILGGTRQLQVISSILGNWEDAANAYADAMNAAGVATEANTQYMDSIEGRIGKFKAAFQEFSTNAIQSSFVKDVVGLGTTLLEIANGVAQITEKIGGLQTVLIAVAGIIMTMKLDAVASWFKGIGSNITGFAKAVCNLATTMGKLPGVFNSVKSGAATLKESLAAAEIAALSRQQIAGGVFAVATVITAVVAMAKHYHEEMIRSATEATSAYEETAASVEGYKSKISELRASLDSGNLSEEEAYNIRLQLLNVQDEICDKLGAEAGAFDVLSGSVDNAKESLDNFAASQANMLLTENAKAFEEARKAMERKRDFSGASENIILFDGRTFGNTLTKEEEVAQKQVRKQVWDIFESVFGENVSFQTMDGVSWSFKLNVDPQQAVSGLQQVNEKMTELETSFGKNGIDLNKILGIDNWRVSIGEAFNEAKSEIEEYGKLYSAEINAMIRQNPQYASISEAADRAKAEYTKAVAKSYGSDEARKAAIQNASDIIAGVRKTFEKAEFGEKENGVKNLFDNLISEMEKTAKDEIVELDLKIRLKNPEDSLTKMIQEALSVFKGENGEIDLDKIANVRLDYESAIEHNDIPTVLREEEVAFMKLTQAADQAEMGVDAFFDVLSGFNYTQGSIANSANVIHRSYDEIAQSAEAAVAVQNSIGNVIEDNTYITEDAYNALATLAGGESELGKCIDKTNGFLVTNAKDLQNVITKSTKQAQVTAKVAKAHEQLKYHKLTEVLKGLVNGMDVADSATQKLINATLSQLNSTDLQIAKFAMLEQQLLGVSNAFSKISEAQAADEMMDYTDDLSSMIRGLADSYENHEFGTEAFSVAFDAIVPENIYSQFVDRGDQIQAGWEYIHDKLYNNYFTVDKNGSISIGYENAIKFAKDALNTAYGDSTVFEGNINKFDLNPQIQTLQEFADAMGVTVEAAFALGNALSKFTTDGDNFLSKLASTDMDKLGVQVYETEKKMNSLLEKQNKLGRSGAVGSDEWNKTREEIVAVEGELSNLKNQSRQKIEQYIEIKSNFDEKSTEVETLKSELDELDQSSPTYTAKLENYETARSELEELIAQLYAFGEPTEIVIQLAIEEVESDIEEVQSQLNEIATYDTEHDIYIAVDTKDESKVDELSNRLNALKAEEHIIEAQFNVKAEDAVGTLETTIELLGDIESNKNKDITITGHFGSTISQLSQIVNSLGNINSKTITVTTNYVQNGTPSSNSNGYVSTSWLRNAKAYGTALQSGSWGIPTHEHNALVGELGEELVVDPLSGKYYTVGESGAELVDLPRGAIIFNHLQTREILRNRRINSRGVAMLEGNAHLSFDDKKYTFGDRTPSSYSSGSKKTSNTNVNVSASTDSEELEDSLEDALEKLKEELDDILGDFDHSIFLLEHKGGTTDEIVAVYKRMMETVHEYADKFRAMGEDENSDYIQEAQKNYFEYIDSIQEKITETYEKAAKEKDNAIKLTENWIEQAIEKQDLTKVEGYIDDIVSYYREKQEILHNQAEYLRSVGYSDYSDEVSALSDEWWECEKNIKEAGSRIVDALSDITEASHEAVDVIQNVFTTLKKAADEYAKNGDFISVDTFQEILKLGPQYMQFLKDENGLLVINEERINNVLKARVQQLAIESAMAYVERLKLAKQKKSTESLEELLDVTVDAANATWELVYANTAAIGLDASEYKAAIKNINAYRALCDTVVNGIGKISGEMETSLNDMKKGLDDILQYTIEMIRKRTQEQIDDLEEMKDAYAKIIALRKEALRTAREEAKYEDKVADKIKQIAKLQERINLLALDDSREAQAERIKLMEEQSDLQKDLSDTQADHAVEAQEDALDKMQDAFEEEKDAEIDVLEDSMSSYQKLYEQAIDYIKNNWNSLYTELIEWNYQYGSDLEEDITTAWNNCLAAAERYGSYVNAMGQIDNDIDRVSGGEAANNTVVSPSTAINGDSEELHSIIKRMHANSVSWQTGDDYEKQWWENENERLAASLAKFGIYAIKGPDGVWYVDKVGGEKLYDKYSRYCYHTGGVAGDIPTLKQKEVLAVLEKGETVLDANKERGLYKLVDFVQALSEKLGTAISGPLAPGSILTAQNGFSELAARIPDSVTNSSANTVHFGDVYIYGANSETVEKHKEVTRKFTNEVLRQLNIKR